MADVAPLIVYFLKLTKSEQNLLSRTLRQFTFACEETVKYAHRKQVYNSRTLSAALNERLQRNYGISSGMAECVCRRVSHDFVALNPDIARKQPRLNVPDYTNNNWFLCSKDTASILAKATHPADFDLNVRVSVNVLKKRLKVPFRREDALTDEGERWHHKEMRVYADKDRQHWTLEVALGNTDGAITDSSPDDEDDGWVPDED